MPSSETATPGSIRSAIRAATAAPRQLSSALAGRGSAAALRRREAAPAAAQAPQPVGSPRPAAGARLVPRPRLPAVTCDPRHGSVQLLRLADRPQQRRVRARAGIGDPGHVSPFDHLSGAERDDHGLLLTNRPAFADDHLLTALLKEGAVVNAKPVSTASSPWVTILGRVLPTLLLIGVWVWITAVRRHDG